eukprot:scaffold94305_cov19-Prasinocladus_malaysianus.AAC.2
MIADRHMNDYARWLPSGVYCPPYPNSKRISSPLVLTGFHLNTMTIQNALKMRHRHRNTAPMPNATFQLVELDFEPKWRCLEIVLLMS